MGYGPKLGLCSVDRTTFERRPKPSATWFEGVARGNRLGPDGH
jgi:beta-glucosidase